MFMRTPSSIAASTTAAVALVLSPLVGDDTVWEAAGGGAFNNGLLWSNGVPGDEDRAIFDLDATFTVTFDNDYDSELLLVGGSGISLGEHINVTFNLSGPTDPFTYSIVGGTTSDVNVFGRSDNSSSGNPGGATLRITGGTLDIAGDLRVAYSESNTNDLAGSVVVSGADAKLVVGGDYSSSRYGTELSALIIEDGASATIHNFLPSRNGGSASNSIVAVSGEGSLLTLSNWFRQISGVMTMTVADGGEVQSGTVDMAGTNNARTHLLVTGAESLFQGGAMRPLSWGSANNRVATIVVADGGEIRVSSVVDRYAGTNNTADYLVTGANSEWNVSGMFNLGGENTNAYDRTVTLTVANGGEVTASELRLHYGGVLMGNSTVDITSSAGVNSRGGTVAPGLYNQTIVHGISGQSFTTVDTLGTLTIDGNYFQRVFNNGTTEDPDIHIGTLKIRIGEGASDRLSVVGNIDLVSLNGLLPLLEIAAFDTPVLAANDTFNILDWTGDFTGEFEISAFDPGSGLSWDFSNLYIDGTISVIPEPGMVALLIGAAAVGCVVLRRRRG